MNTVRSASQICVCSAQLFSTPKANSLIILELSPSHLKNWRELTLYKLKIANLISLYEKKRKIPLNIKNMDFRLTKTEHQNQVNLEYQSRWDSLHHQLTTERAEVLPKCPLIIRKILPSSIDVKIQCIKTITILVVEPKKTIIKAQ